MIFLKDIKVFFRNNLSYLFSMIVFLILLIFLMTGFSENSRQSINYYLNDSSNISLSIVDLLENSRLRLDNTTTREECILSVLNRESTICIVFPEELEISENYNESIAFYTDLSKINSVYYILDIINSNMNVISSETQRIIISDMLNASTKINLNLKTIQNNLSNIQKQIKEIKKATLEIETKLKSIEESTDFSDEDLDYLDLSRTASELISKYRSLEDLTENSLKNLSKLIEETSNQENLTLNLEPYENQSKELEDLFDNITSKKDTISNLVKEVNSFTDYFKDSEKSIGNIKKTLKETDKILTELSKEIESLTNYISKIDLVLNESQDIYSSIKFKDPEIIINPIKTQIIPAVETNESDIILPSLIIIFTIFSALVFSSSLVLFNKTSSGSIREEISPKGKHQFFLSRFESSFLIMLFESILIALVYCIVNHSFIIFGKLLFILLSCSLLFIFIGILLGNISKTKEIGFFLSIIITLAIFFLSSEIIPKEFFSPLLQQFIELNPYEIIKNEIIKTIINAKYPFGLLFLNLITVFLTTLIFSILSYVTFRTTQKLKTKKL